MVDMVKLARTKTERAEEKDALGVPHVPPEDDGVHLYLEPHHLKKLGLHGNVEAGRHVHIRAKGKIKHTSSDQDSNGAKRKRMTVLLTHMAAHHEARPDDHREDVRDDVKEAAGE